MPVPIALFTYKRLEPLKKVLSLLDKNELASETDLFIFSDGPKNDKDKIPVEEVRKYVKKVEGFNKVILTESSINMGLANSIIKGVDRIFEEHEKVIVLEDDLLTTRNFLLYMNQALDKYEETKNVFSISGYSLNLSSDSYPSEMTYFLNRSWSWGWATWKDRWSKVDWEVKDYNSFRSNWRKRSEFAEAGSDLNRMLRQQMEGKLDSWAIRWFYHQYKVKGLTLYPVHSKVQNIGFDEMATHSSGSDVRFRPFLDKDCSPKISFPESIQIDTTFQKRFNQKMGYFARAKSKLKSIVGIKW